MAMLPPDPKLARALAKGKERHTSVSAPLSSKLGPDESVHNFNTLQMISRVPTSNATVEQCSDYLLKNVPDFVTKRALVVGTRTEQAYSMLKASFHKVKHLADCIQYTAFEFEHNFDYAGNIQVHVHLDAAEMQKNDEIEVCLVCARYVVHSEKLRWDREQVAGRKRVKVNKATGKKERAGKSIIGHAWLLQMPNLMPVRFTPCSILVRTPRHGMINQMDINMENVLSLHPTLLVDRDHWFQTPTFLPIKVLKAQASFDRVRFLRCVDKAFISRYTVTNGESVGPNDESTEPVCP